MHLQHPQLSKSINNSGLNSHLSINIEMQQQLTFADWLRKDEVSTSTANIAGFARPMMGIVRRKWLGVWDSEDPFFKNKSKGGTSGGGNGEVKKEGDQR